MDHWYVTMVLNRCPHCQQGELFSGPMTVAKECSHCGAVYERWSGSFTGPIAIGYGLGAAVAALLAAVFASTGLLSTKHIEWVIVGVACATVILSFRWVKAAWIGLMYDWGYIYPDPK